MRPKATNGADFKRNDAAPKRRSRWECLRTIHSLTFSCCHGFMTIHPAPSTPQHTHPNPVGISVDDAVRLSGIGRTSLFAALADGSIKSTKVGRRRIVSYRSLVEFIEGAAA